MNENKSKEERWREEFEKYIPSYNLNKVWNGDYFLERIHHQWIGYLAGRKAGEKENQYLHDHKARMDDLLLDQQKEIKQNREEISQLEAENERLSTKLDHLQSFTGVNVSGEFPFSFSGPDIFKEHQKLKDLVSRAKPCMEYIHSKLPEESEVLDKYRKWNKEAEEVLK